MRRSGFVLTEVVVALLIAAIAVTASYRALAAVMDSQERLRAATESELAASELRRAIAEWIRGAYVRPGREGVRILTRDERGLPRGAFVFSTRSARPLSLRATRIGLFVDPQAGAVLTVAFGDRDLMNRMVLHDAIGGLVVRVLPRYGDDWTSVWNSTAELPRAIELRFTPAAGRELAPLLTLPVLVTLDQDQ